jgi:acetylornithine deacetylase/succinyl-diaminopimelate desuccinylase-like protein
MLSRLVRLSFILLLTYSQVYSQKLTANRVDQLVANQLKQSLTTHREYVSIPNDAAFPKDMDKNIEWLKNAFEAVDFSVQVLETGRIPLVFAKNQPKNSSKLKTILFYLHMDGQPVDPTLWDQEHPFTPVLKKGSAQDGFEEIPWSSIENEIDPEWRIFGRAAADDKGPITMFLQALTIMKNEGIQPAINIKVILDGEEEKGSRGFKETLEKYQELYQADYMIIMDGPAHPTNRPTITFGCRGIASFDLTVYGPALPQHSGHYGNYAPNPAFRMSHLLASMKDEQGRVIIDGFYDGITLDAKVQKIITAVPDDREAINTQLGITKPDAVGNNYQESLQYPSLNVRNISTSWKGPGVKTVIPEQTTVNMGIRLVPESDGERLIELVRNHIERQGYYVIDRAPTPEERRKYDKIATFKGRHGVNAFRTPIDHELGQKLTKAISSNFAEPPVRIRIMGGTVPISPAVEALGIPAVIVPMVNMDNNQHNPNENLRIGNMINGIKICLSIFTGF